MKLNERDELLAQMSAKLINKYKDNHVALVAVLNEFSITHKLNVDKKRAYMIAERAVEINKQPQ